MARNTWKMCQHVGWEDKIQWTNYDARKIHGWLKGPKKGDFVECKMQSGKVAWFEIIQIEYMTNPIDLFMARLKDIGYKS